MIKDKRGLSLIEIIFSLALLSIIVMAIFSGFASSYSMLKRSQNYTDDVFQTQQLIEQEIDLMNEAITEGTEPVGETIVLFGDSHPVTVTYYPRTVSLTGIRDEQSFFTTVAKKNMPLYLTDTTEVDIEFRDHSGSLDHVYVDTSNVYVDSDARLTSSHGAHLTYIYRWYISRDGYHMPMYAEPVETDEGRYYPIFPNDYTIIPGNTSSSLSYLKSSYAGKHIVCTVTSAAKSGKLGPISHSNHIFVSGLPHISDLAVHLDASMIFEEDSSAINEVGGQDRVKRWHDMSDENNDGVQGSSNAQPELIKNFFVGELVSNEQIYDTYVNYLYFETGDSMSVNYTVDPLDSTIFLISKESSEEEFRIYTGDDLPDYITLFSDITLSSSLDDIDVAELIVYDAVLDQSDVDEVLVYLEDKYHPIPPNATIDYLHPLNIVINQGDQYGLPSTILARMTSGRDEEVEVTWVPATINTSQHGTKYSTATAVDNAEKTTTLTLEILEVVQVTGVDIVEESVTLDKGESYALNYNIIPSNAENQTVTWKPTDSEIIDVTENGTVIAKKGGEETVTITSVSGDFEDTCLIVVRPTEVKGVNINVLEDDIYIVLGESRQLTASVQPIDADNQLVYWSTEDSNVVSMDNGLIGGEAIGSTTIQVKTDENNPDTGSPYTDSKRVFVIDNLPTVTPLSGASPYTFYFWQSRNLVFSVEPTTTQKNIITAGLESGTSNDIGFSWNGATLTLTTGDLRARFYGDVRVDLDGNGSFETVLIDVN
ncbi:Ig-like domain-containing protein [Acidaminobacter sp. JC074]|uniref:Ig-like domain-containing protein n=1 Tax=Acidaminobacter sp. JC074 TaxID=2530199 RepID=UPI001F0DD0F9